MIAMFKPELQSFKDLALSFAKKELAPNRESNDRYPFGPFFDECLSRAWEVGFLGITLPEDLGGTGQGIGELCVILDCICRADASLGGIIFTNALSQEIILKAGGSELLGRVFLNARDARDSLIALPSLNNPSEISHVAEARKENGSYLLSGAVEYVVLGGLAPRALIPGRIQGSGYSYFLVDLKDKGVSASEPVLSLGLHACPAVDLTLEGVKAELVGMEGEGAGYFAQASDRMQVAAAAMSLGIMKGSFDEACEYAKTRFQGGREIVNWSELRMMLAEMAIRIKVSDLALAAACRAVEAQETDWVLCSRAAAIHIQSLACELTTDGIQALGGYGYMQDYGQEKRFRDAKHIQSLLGLVPMKKLRYIDTVLEQQS
jgi:alkylation response protein AidB-like acyl-CoA dehydrogenase